MRPTLFRKQVEANLAGRNYGSIRIASPVSHSVWAVCAIAFCSIVIMWLISGTYTRRFHVSGEIIASQGISNIESASSGVATTVFVHEGDSVDIGSPLVSISEDKSSNGANEVLQDVVAKLRIEKESLLDANRSIQASATAQEFDLKTQIDALQNQIDHNAKEVFIDKQQIILEKGIIEKLQPLLTKGYVSPMQVSQETSTLYTAEGAVEHASAQTGALNQQLGSLTSQLKQVPFTTTEKLRENQRSIAQIDEAIDKADLDKQIVIRSPQRGVISSLLVHPNQAIDAQEMLMSITPSAGELQGELLVPSTSMSMIRPGLSVAIHFPAFPFQKFGVFRGSVLSVSSNVLDATQIGHLSGKQASIQTEPSYRVLVKLPAQSISIYGKSERLMPGTAIDADILLENRHLYEWLFEPLYTLRRHMAEDKK
ncbi:HlyD family efflux transporter periplasmic adaptor subunit [Rhodanobacter sp. 7MK24]|uniref:HlyD family secretion protein n=1 Tax=Rhodanobacter sp. 7MK24 TaxID=2775922 RepID=UPI001780DCBB|nr:HlyD family efflux transporter periplasmic adaptor subunit [Rhodanobacter sp. 7MK24]MBD8882427.1 HlyD family efflux transporter periplasmic adaptor subunit [Rhodanobacter sp. 7MK24]